MSFWIRINRVGKYYFNLLPLKQSTRSSLKHWLFSRFPFFFRKLPAYWRWYKSIELFALNAGNDYADSSADDEKTKLRADQKLLRQLFQHSVASFEFRKNYIETDNFSIDSSELEIKLIAFYLPQFHPIAENNEWWGRGFTEWTNVSRAVPQFVGHYQPRLPGELGFYDLRLPEVMKRQIELARQYGIYGFCFYHYWFAGKKLLEKPVEQFLADKSMDFPFCICWANENWTRRWDGLEDDVLIAQDHSPEDDVKFIADLSKMFADERYIRVDGKPLVMVYRASLLPDPKETGRRWREYCRKNNIDEIYLVAVKSFDITDPRPMGFDAVVEFPPHQFYPEEHNGKQTFLNPDYAGSIKDYRELASFYGDKPPEKDFPAFKTVCPSWDNESRKPGRGVTFHNSSPANYSNWLIKACETTILNEKLPDKLMFVNAWNEWGEGAHLEPDRKFGYAYLNATRQVISKFNSPLSGKKIAFVVHDACQNGAQILALNMVKELRSQFGLLVDLLLLEGGPLEEDFEKYASVYRLDKSDLGNRHTRELVKRLYDTGSRFAILNSTASGLLARVLKNAGMQVVSLVHELPGVIKEHNLKRHAKNVIKYSDHIVFPAGIVRDGYAKIDSTSQKKSLIRPQGVFRNNRYLSKGNMRDARIALREKLKLQPDAKIVLGVGFGDYRKGIDLFAEAGIRTMRMNPDVHFVWVGSLYYDMGRLIDQLEEGEFYSSRFHFPGIDLNSDLYYAGADVYALTSREDPFPNVVLEALEVGLPVVAFEGTSGIESLLSRGCGKLAPAFDTDNFAKLIQSLLTESAENESIRSLGKIIIQEEFSFRDYLFGLLSLNNDNRKVTVIIPNYNYAKYLKERILSVISQSYQIYELIVLDDASTDDSLNILEDLRVEIGYDFRIVSNGKNSGSVFAQWRKGVELAQGDFIWIAEADDLSEPDFLDRVMAPFLDENVAMSYCQSKQIDEENRVLSNDYLDYTSDISKNKWLEPYNLPGMQEISECLAIKNTIPNVSAVAFRKDALKKALEKSSEEIGNFRIAGDWIVYLELLRHGNLAYSPESLNLHRRHKGGVTIGSESKPHLLEVLRVQELARKRHKLDLEVINRAKTYSQSLYEYFSLDREGCSKVDEDPDFSCYFE